ncbi:hypothetical protein OXPF_22670 [Oxobacter pfennigii]|uniref:Uncharacterized protein n=1 Tax=Oxobacter pfennigii TaxID=36849 RepID=A0A0P8X024_9CLOT|nr:hypothetical protein OXPF_22670 [Oxobacter pfennigii]
MEFFHFMQGFLTSALLGFYSTKTDVAAEWISQHRDRVNKMVGNNRYRRLARHSVMKGIL